MAKMSQLAAMRKGDRRPRLEDFLRSEKLGQRLGFGALPVLCFVVPLSIFALFTVCYYLSLFVASGRCDCLRAFFVFIMTAYTEADLAAELEQSKLNVQLSVLLLF
jgi:hypothetical protein